MAMTISTSGMEALDKMLSQLGSKAQDVASGALFDGAAVVADAFAAAVGGIQTEPFKYAPPGSKRKPSPEEKAALMGKTGVAKFRKNGSEVDTIVGLTGSAGYADVAGHAKPVIEIARSINSGTSFMDKQPIFRKAKSRSTNAAKAAIVEKAEKMIQEITKG